MSFIGRRIEVTPADGMLLELNGRRERYRFDKKTTGTIVGLCCDGRPVVQLDGPAWVETPHGPVGVYEIHLDRHYLAGPAVDDPVREELRREIEGYKRLLEAQRSEVAAFERSAERWRRLHAATVAAVPGIAWALLRLLGRRRPAKP